MNKSGTPNALANESSPYLLQHAWNPVQWVPFSEEIFARARAENKPLLISIGYSACHWCHVMEHESFEDYAVAELMNTYFINVKVDREERPDVDMLYMQAVQLMTGQGGWPLNCFVLPDGRPFYGGTYFRKDQWIKILETLANLYRNDRGRVETYASELTSGIHRTEEFVTTGKSAGNISRDTLGAAIEKWKRQFDRVHGGVNRAPKFPMPTNYRFLLRYAQLSGDEEVMRHVNLTLQQMAFGGIYDQLHGGFARYSTDEIWKVPHFEKMLYDNAQLCDLYTEAFLVTGNSLYREVAEETLSFMAGEWLGREGCFYSAYDADSEGEEGKYYVWSEEELQSLLGDDFDRFADYFQVNNKGYWEHGNYILMRNPDVAAVQLKHNVTREELLRTIERCREALRKAAATRVKPGLDDKTITAWHAMTVTAFAKAAMAFGKQQYHEIARKSMDFLLQRLTGKNGTLFRTYKNNQAKITGFLDDYAFAIESLITMHVATHDVTYLSKAHDFAEKALRIFDNPGSPLLFYTPSDGETLVARTTESSDNVTPASNSQMAINLFYLSRYFAKPEWSERAEKMLAHVAAELPEYPSAYSNWGCLSLHLLYPFREIAVVGKDVDELTVFLYRHGIPNAIFAGSRDKSELPLLAGRMKDGKTLIYVCENNACHQPLETIEDALSGLRP